MIIKNLHKYLYIPVKGAIHIGANVGEEAEWYNKYNFTHVIWFEVNKELIPTLEKNVAQFSHQKVLPYGIHDSLDKATLHIANNSGQSSSLLNFGTHKKYHPEVKHIKDVEVDLFRLDWIIENLGIDIQAFNFLNVDVEGTELNVIKSLGKYLKGFNYVYAEVRDEQVYEGCPCICDMDEYLYGFGFGRLVTKMTKAHWGDALYIKK